jgi:glycosyltransferase involved in cell wall biosynthesis
MHVYHVPGDERQPLWGYAQSLDADVKLKKKVVLLAPFAMRNLYRKALEAASLRAPDLVHAHWALPNGFVGMMLARKLIKPLVVSLHGSDMFLARRNVVFRSFASRVLKDAEIVTACSPDLKQQAETISTRAVELTEYGVDTGVFHPPATIDPARGAIFAVGRLVHKKGFIHLLEAFADMHTYYSNSMLIIAGAGPLLARLQGRARDLGVADRVEFRGNVERGRLPDYFREAAVAAAPSITDEYGNRDGLPNVVLEAMASGAAVVASDIPGIRNVIRHMEEGVIVPEGDVKALSGALQALLKDPELRARLGRNARRKAESELSWDVKIRQLESLYRSVVEVP